MSIEEHIEELRAELSICQDARERAQIAAELQAASAAYRSDLARLRHRA